eukprot:TRINITY_DN141887_c0_g1_i1.p2 TRINITY_DN141887_c0_g1~~TRINITY_DN141887_c0_g1_i1.p2  ORF type:complete len:120 (+),score=33.27 TRINITY_DN141887_c0_g1_i1:35-394(+)
MGSSMRTFLADKTNDKAAYETFQKYDADKSGALDKKEFVKFAKDLVNLIKDPKTSMKEFLDSRGVKTVDEMANNIYEAADSDKNGKITYPEFKREFEKYAAKVEHDDKVGKGHHEEKKP